MSEPSPSRTPPELLGESAAMAPVRLVLTRAARVDAPLVLEGETGTGKSLAARWVHERSPRREGPFIGINCAGIPDALFESEFFGHRRGAFTGAVDDRAGLFEAASGGTLFLDEVAELPPTQQAKLLTVLEEGRVRRVGDARTRTVDTRVVAATSTDLDRAVAGGTFRPDLFHRLALLRCTLPPLRDRDGDVERLSSHFIEVLGRRHLGTPARLTPAARAALAAHPWPGNVRELVHVLEAALILAGRRLLDRSHLEPVMGPRTGATAAPVAGADVAEEVNEDDRSGCAASDASPGGVFRSDGTDDEAGGASGARPPADAEGRTGPGGRYSFYGTDEEERAMIEAALERFRGNRTRTARHLGMSRGTLRGRIRRYGI